MNGCDFMYNELLLFPGCAPGSENVKIEEVIIEEEWDQHLKKRIVSGVTSPSIIPFIPKEPNGIAVLVIPGGAYRRQVLNIEGTDIAQWLNTFGVTAFVLKHRMPCDGHENFEDVPLQDAQRAIRLIRSNASKFNIDVNKLGVMGFSAGGHLASTIGTCYDRKVYKNIDAIDIISAKPDFLVLGYPCISVNGWDKKLVESSKVPSYFAKVVEKYGTDEFVTTDTPPTFIMVANDDTTTPVEHSVSFYLALRKAGVPAELHIFKEGRHGFGLGITRGRTQCWTDLCKSWIDSEIK
jgi:acetyl esterase/lipase